MLQHRLTYRNRMIPYPGMVSLKGKAMAKGYKTKHEDNLARLSRIEGQIRGIKRMIEEAEYCMDIVTQIDAAISALKATKLRILHKHLDHCVADAVRTKSKTETEEKIKEVLQVIKRSCK